MAGGKEVGRVQIRVLPETKGFAQDLRRKLNQIEKSVQLKIKATLDDTGLVDDAQRAARRASKSAKVTIDAVLDENGIRNSVAAAKKKAQAQADSSSVKAQLEIDPEKNWRARLAREVKAAAGRLEAQIPLTVDGERMRTELAQTVKKAAANLNATVPVDPEQAASFRAKAQKIVDQIESRAAELKIEAETNAARQQAEDLRNDINGKNATFNINADTGLAAARIAVLARDRIINLHARLSASSVGQVTSALAGLSGLRVVGDSLKGLRNALTGLDRATPKIAGLALAITNLGSAALAATSNAFALGGSLASIIPAALALPGILAGFAVGAVTTFLALKDIGTVLSDLGPRFTALQDSISSSFWDKAEAPIRNLANSVLPVLEAKLTAVASSLGGFFSEIAAGLSTDLSLGQLGAQMDYLKTSIDTAAKAGQPLVRAIMTLGTAGASYLPQLADWFVKITTQFDAFITKAAGDGRLHQWISSGVSALQDFGRVIANASGILGGFASAAANAGGASLGALADGLERVNQAINGPVWQGALTTVFQGAHDAMAALAPGVGALGDAFISLAPTLAQIMVLAGQAGSALLEGLGAALMNPALQAGATALFQGILTGIQALQPAFPVLGAAAGALMSVMGTLASTLGPVLGAAIQALAPAFMALMTAIQPIIPVLGQALISALTAIGPAITAAATGIASFTNAFPGLSAVIAVLAAALIAVLPVIVSIVAGIVSFATTIAGVVGAFGGLSAVITAVSTAFSALAAPVAIVIAAIAALAALFAYAWATSEPFRAAVMGLAQAFMGLVTTVAGALMPILTSLAGAVFPALMTVVNALVPVFTLVIQIITTVITALTGLVTFIVGMLMPVFQAILPVITTVFTAIGTIIAAAIGIVQGILTAFLGLLQGNWSMMWQGLVMIVQSVWALLVAVVTGAIAILNAIITAGLTLLSTMWSALWNALVAVVTMVWNAIVTSVQASIARAQAVVSAGLSAVQAVVSAILSAVLSFFASTWASIVSAVSSAISTVQSVISAGMSAALSIVSSIMSAIMSVVSSIWSAITSFISSAIATVVSVISSGFSSALSVVSSVMSSIISAVSSGASSVISTFSSMVSSAISVLTGMIGQAASIGSQIIAGLANAISAGAGAVVGALKGVVSSAISAAKSALGIHSPSRVFRGIGEFTVAGLVKGLTGKASEAKKASGNLAKGITQVFQKNAEAQRKRMGKKSILGDPKAQAKAFYDTYARASTDALQKLASQRDGLLKKLDAQKKKLDDLYKERNDKAASLRDQYMGSFDLGKSSRLGIQGLIQGARTAANAIYKLRSNIWKLKQQGFSQNMINDVAAMDPTEGNRVAQHILKSTRKQREALKAQYKRLEVQSKGAGKLVSNYMYSTGIQAANGLISGLKSQLSAVDVASKVLADRLVGTVRRRLGIHSPSRVMATQGRFSVEGFVKGLRDNAHMADLELRALTQGPQMPVVPRASAQSQAQDNVPLDPLILELLERIAHAVEAGKTLDGEQLIRGLKSAKRGLRMKEAI